MSTRDELDKLELERSVSSAKQLHDINKRMRHTRIEQVRSANHFLKNTKQPDKPLKVRRKNYTKPKIRKDFPGAWLYAEQVIPIPVDEKVSPNKHDEARVAEANELIHWHRQNGTLDSLRSTYRGDFYTPVPGSPEEQVYWGDFYDVGSYVGVMRQERALRELRKEFNAAEKRMEVADAAIEENYKKAKAQQKRWNRRLEQINELAQELVERLDMIMPSSMFPRMLNDEDLITIGHRSYLPSTQKALAIVDEEEAQDQAHDDWKRSIVDTLSFDEIRQLIRDRDRLVALNYQKADILRKIEGWEEKQGVIEMGLMEEVMDAMTERDELADQMSEMMKSRGTRNDEIKGLLKLRSALAHNSADADEQIDKHRHMLGFYDGTPFEAMIKDRLEARTKEVSGTAHTRATAQATATVMRKTKGTLYEGTITVPGHSTVEVELDTLIEENDSIEDAKEITLKTDVLRKEKLEERQKQKLRDDINTKTMVNIATMLPAAMVNASKDIPPSAGGAMRHDMQKLEEWNLVGKTSVQCRALPKRINGREVEHARSAIALRGGVIVPRDIFLIDVLHHWKTNFYVCQVITHDSNKLCALALGVERSGQYAGKLVARTAFYWRPDLWTQEWEASNARVSTEQPGVTLEDLRQEHERLVKKLPMQATDILGITMNDPVTHMIFN